MKGSSLLFLVILVVVFYFLLILPQRRQQKKKAQMMKQVGPGAKVMTASGIYGEIVSMHDDVVIVRVAEDVELEMDARAIVRVVSEAGAVDETSHALGAPEYDENDDDQVDDEMDEDFDDEEEVEEDHESKKTSSN